MQIGNSMRSLLVSAFLLFAVAACNPKKHTPNVVELKPCVEFNADSAFGFIEQQLSFGYRIPGTEAHRLCGDFLAKKLSSYGFNVIEQTDSVVGYDKRVFPLRNIIGRYNPKQENRILLCGHWDSRPHSDQSRHGIDGPIAGANDNASGVAVMLELARIISDINPKNGIDIVLFDVEDQGRHAKETAADMNDHGYCLGSEYWSMNVTEPKPQVGVLLDMVGAPRATFNLEHFTRKYALEQALEIWDLGNQMGFGESFIYNQTFGVYDDHMHVNEIAGIPCVGIIHQDIQQQNLFWEHWHTEKDNLAAIDKTSLTAVGQTVAQYLCNHKD